MFRIKKYPKGYVVEVQKTRWWGKKYWTHFVAVSGIPSDPWFHVNYEHAETGLLREIKWSTIKNSKCL